MIDAARHVNVKVNHTSRHTRYTASSYCYCRLPLAT